MMLHACFGNLEGILENDDARGMAGRTSGALLREVDSCFGCLGASKVPHHVLYHVYVRANSHTLVVLVGRFSET